MTTLIHFFGTVPGVVTLILSAAFLGGLGICFYRRMQAKRSEANKQAKRQKDLEQLDKQERDGLMHFKTGKFQLSEASFRAAAVQAGKLGDQYRQWKNQHHAFVAMSRTDSSRVLAALQGLQKLLVELSLKLPVKDKLLLMAQQNLAKIEKNGLNQAAEAEFRKATELFDAGKFDQAKAVYEQAYRAAQHAKNPVLCALVLNDSSRILAQSKQFDEAIRVLDKALKIAKANCESGHELPANIAWNLDYYHGIQQESHIKDLLVRVRAAHQARRNEESMELADKAVSEALKTVKADHWLTAEALHHRGCIKMGQGFYSDARGDFDQALAILSEWPEQCARLIELANTNLEKCRNDMGY